MSAPFSDLLCIFYIMQFISPLCFIHLCYISPFFPRIDFSKNRYFGSKYRFLKAVIATAVKPALLDW